MDLPINVFFLCAHNTAGSIMAEVILNHSEDARVRGFSAGREPREAINPMTSRVLENSDMETGNLRSKSWDEFAGDDGPPAHVVITVCKSLEGDAIPDFPGNLVRSHWPIEGLDPVNRGQPEEKALEVFVRAFDMLESCIHRFLELPLEQMSAADLEKELERIWRNPERED